MNIFGIGGAELVLIFVIMLMVAGPKRMVRWAFVLGQYLGKLRRMWEDVVDVMQQEVDAAGLDVKIPKELPTRASVTKLVSEVVKPYADPIQETLNEVQQPVKDTISEAKAAASGKKLAEKEAPVVDKAADASALETKNEGFGAWSQSQNSSQSTNKEAGA